MPRLAPVLAFGLMVVSIAAAAMLVMWSLMAQWPHWSRHGEPLGWFTVGYGPERHDLALHLDAGQRVQLAQRLAQHQQAR